MKQILITGGAGMIGSNLAKRLVAESSGRIRVADNLWRGRQEYLLDPQGNPVIDMESDFLKLDLRNPASCLQAVEGVDEVYHLADVVAGIKYVFANQRQVFHDNLLIDTNMLRASQLAGVKRFLYVGTACSYPREKQYGADAPPLVEDDMLPANPESAYGWSKLAAELQTGIHGLETDMQTGVLRLHNVYGAPTDYSPDTSQVIPSLIVKAIQYPAEPFIVWGSGNQGRSFIHVDDVVEGLMLMMTKGLGKGAIQIGTNHCTTIRELAEMITAISKKHIDIEYDLSKPEGDRGRCANCSKAELILGWEPKVSMLQGLAKTYAWIIKDTQRRKDLSKITEYQLQQTLSNVPNNQVLT